MKIIKKPLKTWINKNLYIFQIDPVTLFDLIKAANYIESKALLDACSKYMANAIQGKSKQEVWGMFKPAFEKCGHPMKDDPKESTEVVEPET